MKLESRTFSDRVGGELITRKLLLFIPKTREESELIDKQLGAIIPTEVRGAIDLSNGYGQHYIRLEAASQPEAQCRRCSECEEAAHHWIEYYPLAVCKHCDAKGIECPSCSGSGIAGGLEEEDAQGDEQLRCATCSGEGLLQIHEEKLN